MQNDLLLVFVKNPVLGKVKTRLAQTVGDAKALEVYHQLLRHTHEITRALRADKYLCYSDSIEYNDIWEKNSYTKMQQNGADLGERMLNSFIEAFSDNYKRVVIIGSDCPELQTRHIEHAFALLKEKDVVIGPAGDGGYYLLGMNKLIPSLFLNKKWSTSHVMSDTMDDIQRMNLQYTLLPVLSDVDEEKDLHLMNNITNPIKQKL
jgi:rSAM/selenodomain-associated transferase 1